MLRNLYSFAAGAATITAVIVGAAARPAAFVGIGFALALALVAIAGRLIGARRLSLLFAKLDRNAQATPAAAQSRPQTRRRPVERPTAPAAPSAAPRWTETEREVISALMNLGTRKPTATAATAAATKEAPQEFKPMFLAALRLTRSTAA